MDATPLSNAAGTTVHTTDHIHTTDHTHTPSHTNSPNNTSASTFTSTLAASAASVHTSGKLETAPKDVDATLPAFLATGINHLPWFQHVLNMSGGLDHTDKCGRSLATYAATIGRPDMLQELVTRGVNMNTVDAGGHLPLVEACSTSIIADKRVQCVRILTAAGADVTAADVNGLTPLLAAAGSSNVAVMSMLLDMYWHVDASTTNRQRQTPLHAAAAKGSMSMISLLLQYGVDVDAVDVLSNAPIHVAAINQRLDVVVQLLLHGSLCSTSTTEDERKKQNDQRQRLLQLVTRVNTTMADKIKHVFDNTTIGVFKLPSLLVLTAMALRSSRVPLPPLAALNGLLPQELVEMLSHPPARPTTQQWQSFVAETILG